MFSLAALSSLALQGALQDVFYNDVVSSDVAKPGELASLYLTRALAFEQGSLFIVSHIRLFTYSFVRSVYIFVCSFSIRNAEEYPEAFRFKWLGVTGMF